MKLRHAIDMLAPAALAGLGPTVWADLGCGDGTFTRALAHGLAPGSIIHAIDRRPGMTAGGDTPPDVRIEVYRGDFMRQPWPFDHLNGVLMANSLHYVRDQAGFLRECLNHLRPGHRFLIVEYDISVASRWVPYPLDRRALADLFAGLGYAPFTLLKTRPSVYQQADLYSALIATA